MNLIEGLMAEIERNEELARVYDTIPTGAYAQAVLVKGQPPWLGDFRGADTAQHCLDPRHHLPWAVGFAHVVVCAQLEAEQAVDLLHPGSGHDDGHRTEGPDIPADLQPVPSGEHQIQQNQPGSIF